VFLSQSYQGVYTFGGRLRPHEQCRHHTLQHDSPCNKEIEKEGGIVRAKQLGRGSSPQPTSPSSNHLDHSEQARACRKQCLVFDSHNHQQISVLS
jgi:hypothetical protein